MSAVVVAFRGAVVPGEPVPNVVEAVGDILNEALRGQIRAVAWVAVTQEGVCLTGWEQPEIENPTAVSIESHALGSGILTLAYRYGAATAE